MKILQAFPMSGSNSAPEPSKPTPKVLVSPLSPVPIAKLGSLELSGLSPFSFPCLVSKWWTGDSCSEKLSQPAMKITFFHCASKRKVFFFFFWGWVYHSCFVFMVYVHPWHIIDAHMVSWVEIKSRKASHLRDVFSLAEISLAFAVIALLLLNPCRFHCYNFYGDSPLA